MPQPVPTIAHWPEGVPQDAELAGDLLFAQLEARAAADPDRPALPSGGATYAELLDASLMLAGYMQQRLGVRRGSAVLVLLDDCPEYAVTAFAIARCCAQAVVLDARGADGAMHAGTAGSSVRVAVSTPASLPAIVPLLEAGTLSGCIVCGAVLPQAGLHDFAGALAAGIAPLPHAVDVAATRSAATVPPTV